MATLIWGEHSDGVRIPAVVASVKECEAAWPHDRHEWFGVDAETDLTSDGIGDDRPVLTVCTRKGNAVWYWDDTLGSIAVDANRRDGREIICEFGIEITDSDVPEVTIRGMRRYPDGWPW